MKPVKKILARAAAVTAAAGVAMSTLFGSPAELVNGAEDTAPRIVAEAVSEAPDAEDTGDEDDESGEEKKKGLKNYLRQMILKLPAPVRVLVCVPIWAAGWAVTGAASALWAGVLSPLAGAAAAWAIGALFVFAAAAAAVKALFPDVPLSKILTKENAAVAAGGTLLIWILCAALPAVVEDFGKYDGLVKFLGGLLVIAVIVLRAKFGSSSYDRAYVME